MGRRYFIPRSLKKVFTIHEAVAGIIMGEAFGRKEGSKSERATIKARKE